MRPDAAGAGHKRGIIRITTRLAGTCAQIDISDTGAGISETIRPRIFEPFFTTKPVGKGTGQGLALAHSIVVDKHRGSITFASTPGVGTTFTLRLPVTDPGPG